MLNTIYQVAQTLLNKDQQGYMPPEQFDLLFNQESAALYNQLVGLPEDYKPGAPIPSIGYDLTQVIADALLPFKIPGRLQIGSNGQAPYPSDYVHASSLMVQTVTNGKPSWRNIKIIVDSELASRLSSSVKPPSLKYPVCTFYNNYIQFYPNNLLWCKFTYLSFPNQASWGFTYVNNEPVYDPTTTVETLWKEPEQQKLAIRVVRAFAAQMQEQEMTGFANEETTKGA
jgi:hypothetical protein